MGCCYKIGQVVTLFVYSWVWWSIHCEATILGDSLKSGDTLNTSSSLSSKNNKFSLTFTSLSENQFELRIVALRGDDSYSSVLNLCRNQDFPSPALLSLNHSGFLKIDSQYGKPTIIYSPPQPTNNIVGTLLDNGNFVLRELHPNRALKDIILWQSFDYPSESLVAGMKLGVNRKTGHKISIVSNLVTFYHLQVGAFSLEWELSELVIKNRGKVYWRSGKLIKNGTIFKNIPESRQLPFQYNTDDDSFSFEVKNGDDKKFPIWWLSPIGELFSDYGKIAEADKCYGFNVTDERGCQKRDIPSCRKPGNVFKKFSGKPSYINVRFQESSDYGYSDCKQFCWSSCRCIGFKMLYENQTGCVFFRDNSTIMYDKVEATDISFILTKSLQESPPQMHLKAHKGNKWLRVIVLLAILATALFIACTFLALKKRSNEPTGKKEEMIELTTSNQSAWIKDLEDDLTRQGIKVFNFSSVLAATANFSPENKIGEGGYGPVYKGILPTGEEIAVKKLSKTSTQGIAQFKSEVTLISELQHKNLVHLLGCCIQEEEQILIYEYMPNKSLDLYLFDCSRRQFLDWKKRFQIINGISQGILYIHQYSRIKIVHRDLKVSNILLDENMNPKISDFGMARMFLPHESTAKTTLVGTIGYMSPEYAMTGVCSTKSDVFSFGVMLLEIVSGRRNIYEEDTQKNILGHAWELWRDGECLRLIDPSLGDVFDIEEVQRCIHIGLLCVEYYADDRPTISDIVSMLTSTNPIDTLPKVPGFYSEHHKGATTSRISHIFRIEDVDFHVGASLSTVPEICQIEDVSTSSEVG